MALLTDIAPGTPTGSIELVVGDADIDRFIASLHSELPIYARPENGERRRVPPELVAKLGMMATIQDFCIATFGQNLRSKQTFRFLAPVYVGMLVHGRGRFIGDFEKRGRHYVSFEAEYRDRDGRLLVVDQRIQCVIDKDFALKERTT